MKTRLEDVTDIKAAEACYHLQHCVQFGQKSKQRSSKSSGEGSIIIDKCKNTLCGELITGLSLGHVYNKGKVWDKYVTICKDMGIGCPQRYQSRRAVFHDGVQCLIGSKAKQVRPLSKACVLMYPADES